MSDLYWLMDEQMTRLSPYFPKSHGKPRVDDRRVLSGIIFVNRERPALAGYAEGIRAAQDIVQSLGAVGRDGRFYPDDGGPVRAKNPSPNRDDRRNLPQGAPHGFQPWGKKGISGA